MTELEQLTELRDRVATEFGRCDVLVNNAGIRGGGAFEDVGVEHLDRVIDVNLSGRGPRHQAVPPHDARTRARSRREHRVARGRFATPGAAIYGATGHAVVAFSEALYHELGPKGILVTTVNPGFADRGVPPDRPAFVRLDPDDVAKVIVDVVRKGRHPRSRSRGRSRRSRRSAC